MHLIDTHAHLDFPDFDSDRQAVITELAQKQIGVIDVATDKDSVERINILSRDNQFIWGTVGLHPTEITSSSLIGLPTLMLEWRKIIEANSKIVAIGEIGLDYFHNRNDDSASRQKAALRMMLTFAEEQKLPVIFHCREAYGDLISLLKDYRVTGVIHCFSGTQAQAQSFLDLGFYLSATAIITYPKNEALAQVFAAMPQEKLMVETDSPFLPPQEKRGSRNDPRNVERVAEFLAQLRGQSLEEVTRLTTQNAINLFKLEV